jgi:putative DNA primase/helicase
MIKSLTGEGTLRIERKFRDSFEFTSRAKLTIVSNYLLSFRDVGNSMKRRLRTVPFLYCPESVDAGLEDRLMKESGGILRLMILEAGLYLASSGPCGFPACRTIEEASGEYLAGQDVIGLFLADRVESGNDWEEIRAGEMYSAYKVWCEENGYRATNTTRFGRELKTHGIEKVAKRDGKYYLKLKFKEGM